ncbi:MAG TPA: hypothetical protein VFA05_04335 [Gaiellaceae bacterium]|nr:hypothetical protein [Gaiellaceae bacterium]
MRWVWSYGVWAGWLFAFLALELAGLWRVVPWVTLSETSWHAERTYPVLYVALCGFLIGLNLHIVLRVSLWRAVLFGLVVAAGAHLLNRAWP